MGVVAEDLLVGDFDHLVLGHAGGEDGAELLVEEEGEGSAGGVASAGGAPPPDWTCSTYSQS